MSGVICCGGKLAIVLRMRDEFPVVFTNKNEKSIKIINFFGENGHSMEVLLREGKDSYTNSNWNFERY